MLLLLLLACTATVPLVESDSVADLDLDADGWTEQAGDCNDNDPALNPGATEVCNGIDDDCDGLSDEEDDGLVALTWYRDADGDSYGADALAQVSCEAAGGYVGVGGDCDDANVAANPAATEVCDDADNDCDGLVDGSDPDVQGASVWYYDGDGDGHGDPSDTDLGCHQPEGYVAVGDDCDDTDPTNACDALLRSCTDILESGASTGDGNYAIDPDGTGGFEVYCDMTSYGGGWTLIAQGGTLSCHDMSPGGTMRDDSSCTYLEFPLVQALAGAASEVMLRVGSSSDAFGDWTKTTRSTNDLAVEALLTATGTWHNGAAWDGWGWSYTCSPDWADGWPDMYQSCGICTNTHWLAHDYAHSDNACESTTTRISSTWLR